MPSTPILPQPLRRGISLALDLVFPKRCVSCGRFGELVCARCAASLEPATGPGRCPHCAARWDGPDNCPRCFAWVALDGAVAAVEMEGAARRIVHDLKYKQVRILADTMADTMSRLHMAVPFDFALPIPLHSSRLKQRGFNQAALLVEKLAWPEPDGALRRTKRTDQQVGKHLTERRKNVGGAFSYSGGRLNGCTIALVDDVITTGATADECAKILKDYGAERVIAVAFARASYDPTHRGRLND